MLGSRLGPNTVIKLMWPDQGSVPNLPGRRPGPFGTGSRSVHANFTSKGVPNRNPEIEIWLPEAMAGRPYDAYATESKRKSCSESREQLHFVTQLLAVE